MVVSEKVLLKENGEETLTIVTENCASSATFVSIRGWNLHPLIEL
jgi:hypothetical protein